MALLIRWLLRKRPVRRRILRLLETQGKPKPKSFSSENHTRTQTNNSMVEIEIPEAALKYAEKVAKTTGLSLYEVMGSEPFKKYLSVIGKRVRVKVPREVAEKLKSIRL